MKTLKLLLIASGVIMLVSCLKVRQQDLDAWIDVPVEALDTHSIFITIPMYKTITNEGVEIRNYVNGADVANCFSSAAYSSEYVSASVFTTCSSQRIVCNNLFYIKDGIVKEYAPTGRCYTNEKAQPQSRYLRLKEK